MKDFFKALLLSSLFALFCFSCDNANHESQTLDTDTFVNVGDTAKDFTVQMYDGSYITLSDLRGKVVLLTFWASWCPPCDTELKAIPEKILNHYVGKDFVFLPIAREETVESIQKKIDEFKSMNINFPIGLDPTREIYSQYAKKTIPRNYIIDKNGIVVYSNFGYSEKGVKQMISKINKSLR